MRIAIAETDFNKIKLLIICRVFIAKAEEEIHQVLCMVLMDVWLRSLDYNKRYGDENSGSRNVVF